MASRNAFPGYNLGPELFTIHGSFAPNGTNPPAAASIEGALNSVTRTGAGLFLVTLKDQWLGLVAAIGALQLNVAGDSQVQFGAYDAAAKTLVVRILTAGAAADVAANANNRVHLALTFRNTSHTIKS